MHGTMRQFDWGRLFAEGTMRYRLIMISLVLMMTAVYGTLVIVGPAFQSHDELNYLLGGLKLLGDRKIFAYGHGPLLYEIAALTQMGAFGVLKLAGKVQSPHEFIIHAVEWRDVYLRILHAFAGVAGVATICQVYRVGVIFGGRRVGTIAALLCASNFTFLVMTSIFKEEPFYWFFVLAAMEATWKTVKSINLRCAGIAGACIGLGICAKYLAVVGVLLAALPVLLTPRASRMRGILCSATMLGAMLVTILVFFPFLITDFDGVIKSLSKLNSESISAVMGSQFTLKAYFSPHLTNLVGWPILVLGGIELLRRIATQPKGPVVLAVAPFAILLMLGLRPGYSMAHYVFLPAVMFMILATCAAFAALARVHSLRVRRLLAIGILVVTMASNHFALGALKYLIHLTGPLTKEIAKEKLLALAQDGDCVAMNMAINGENIYGPNLTPNNSPPGHGPYTIAIRAVNDRREPPRFALRLVPGADFPSAVTDGCRWLVVGRTAAPSYIEFGHFIEKAHPPIIIPTGFVEITRVDSLPGVHSDWYPFPTSLDYEDYAHRSIIEIFTRGALGLDFQIYRREG